MNINLGTKKYPNAYSWVEITREWYVCVRAQGVSVRLHSFWRVSDLRWRLYIYVTAFIKRPQRPESGPQPLNKISTWNFHEVAPNVTYSHKNKTKQNKTKQKQKQKQKNNPPKKKNPQFFKYSWKMIDQLLILSQDM